MIKCSIENCDEPKKVKNLCSYHYNRKRYKGDFPLHPSKRVRPDKICAVFDCSDKVQAISLCQKHYKAFDRFKRKNEGADIREYVITESLRKKRPPIGLALLRHLHRERDNFNIFK